MEKGCKGKGDDKGKGAKGGKGQKGKAQDAAPSR